LQHEEIVMQIIKAALLAAICAAIASTAAAENCDFSKKFNQTTAAAHQTPLPPNIALTTPASPTETPAVTVERVLVPDATGSHAAAQTADAGGMPDGTAPRAN